MTPDNIVIRGPFTACRIVDGWTIRTHPTPQAAADFATELIDQRIADPVYIGDMPRVRLDVSRQNHPPQPEDL